MRSSIARVGVRELRQNLSVYLRRVAAGHALEVTEHGRPVALLSPLSGADSPIERMIASGRASRPARDLVALGAPKGRTSRRLSRALQSLRNGER